MSMNKTPTGERIHIALFGRTNAGKSSLINAITGQDLAIVSDVKGTTTDPVYKAMELLPLGPVMLIDTPGLDDEGELGAKRTRKARSVLNKTDIALVVADGKQALTDFSFEEDILTFAKEKNIPTVVVMTKQDEWKEEESAIAAKGDLCVSSNTGYHIEELKNLLAAKMPTEDSTGKLIGDLLSPGDIVVLVVPIDKAAPKGRLILPQQQVIRDVLDSGAISVVCRDNELADTLTKLGTKPRIVVTDSQAFGRVSNIVPEDIDLTSFSILMSRYKGDLETQIRGVKALESLKDGDTILMAEGCTHHRQCEDIGTVKLPRWIREYTGKELTFETSSGGTFPEDVTRYQLIVHCGGCTLPPREMAFRIAEANDQNIPIANYGTLIAYMNGILTRSIKPFEKD